MKMKETKKKKTTAASKNFLGKEGFIRPYQKTGQTDFDELQVIDFSNNEGTNSRVANGRIGREEILGMVRRMWAHERRHKTHNGW